ncbi:unnamed protein product, partial [Prunus brigantina]
PRHIDDNLCYVGGLTRVLAPDAFISFPGVLNADTGGDCENEDEDDFSFTCTNPNGSPISTDDIFQNAQIRSVFPIFNRDLLFADADDDDSSRARGVAASSSYIRLPLKKLFFKEQDTPTSAMSFYNSGGGLGSWSMRSTSF